MRTIASLAVIAALTLTSAGALTAQGGRAGGMRGRGPGGPAMMDRALLKGITLSDAQQASLKQIREADRANMQATMQQERADMDAIRAARQSGDTAKAHQLMEAQRAKMETQRDAQIAAIRGILTSDQLTQFDANVADMKKHARGRRGGPPHSR